MIENENIEIGELTITENISGNIQIDDLGLLDIPHTYVAML